MREWLCQALLDDSRTTPSEIRMRSGTKVQCPICPRRRYFRLRGKVNYRFHVCCKVRQTDMRALRSGVRSASHYRPSQSRWSSLLQRARTNSLMKHDPATFEFLLQPSRSISRQRDNSVVVSGFGREILYFGDERRGSRSPGSVIPLQGHDDGPVFRDADRKIANHGNTGKG